MKPTKEESTALSYDDIAQALHSKAFVPVYLLCGEEPFFIDELTNSFAHSVIPIEEQDFNLSVLYGTDTELRSHDILAEAMQFPWVGARRVVIVKEAQQVRDLDNLSGYLGELPDSTVLVLAYKKKIDKRLALYKNVQALGGYYESHRVKEWKIPDFIISLLRREQLSIDPRTATLMTEYTGSDLEKIHHEITKLSIALSGRGEHIVTPEDIETYVGISKEYNNFELLRAIAERNAPRVYAIAFHFMADEKKYPLQMTLSVLFNFFSALLAVQYLPDKSERSISTALKINPYACKDYAVASQRYSSGAVFSIIHQIRLSDAASKGVDSIASNSDILKELLTFILGA